jgi:N-acetylglucosaminyldiphosphoundecaprenol N-acetyl-beta-D-mannosaminyltransferase
MSSLKSIKLLGVKIHLATVEDVLRYIEESLGGDNKTLICHAHVMALNLAYEQLWFRNFINSANLVYCDGMGVRLGARILGYPELPPRFTLADWIWTLAEFAAERDYSLFFLGNPPGSAQKAASRLQQTFPDLRVVGTHHGYFNKSANSPENQEVLFEIEAAHPDILLVGFGMPVQERWIYENWGAITARLVFPCGAIFEYVAGDLKRGPSWMTNNYMEWLARMIISPQRYITRYFRDNPKFLWRILMQKFSPLAESV